MFIVTERKILRKIEKQRYKELNVDKDLSKEEKDEILSARRVWGVLKNHFMEEFLEHEIITKLKKTRFLSLYKFFNVGRIVGRVNDILENSVQKGYLMPLTNRQNENYPRLRLTQEGRVYISKTYYLKLLYKNNHTQSIITAIINWGIPLMAIWIASHFFNISIESIR